jgi:tetratricopeptide (TPR) repeat protein
VVVLLLGLALTSLGLTQSPDAGDVAQLMTRARADSNDPLAHYPLAIAYLARKQYLEGEASLHQALAIDPQLASGYFYLAAIPRKRSIQRMRANWGGIPLEISVLGDDSVARESRRLRRVAFLLNPLLDFGRPPRREVPLAWAGGADQALDDFREGRYQQAYDRLTDLIARSSGKSDSVSATFLWYHALSAAQLVQFDVAIKDVIRLRDRAEHGDRLRMMLGRMPFSADDYGFVIAFLHQLAGHHEEAVGAYQEVLERNIGLYTAHIRLAEIREEQRDWAGAVEERQRAVAANPDDPSLVFDLGATLQRAGRNDDAVTELRRSIELNPRETLAYYDLGLAYLALGRTAEGHAALQQFVTLAPSRYRSRVFDARWRLAQSP